jgi:ethanolamine-phosphate cytidylyltransferase
MEVTENLKRLACLLAVLNKEGLDTKLIEIGVELMPKINDDDNIRVENDLEQIKMLFKNYQEGKFEQYRNEIISELKDKKPVRAYVDGCYDLMHAGHYNALRQSSKLGDILVCGVNSDEEIQKVKGPPVFNSDERWTIVRACKWVDEVAQDTEYTPTIELLDRYNWDFYAHGDDVALNADGTDCSHFLKSVGRFKMFKRTRGVSTTDIAAKLLKIHSLERSSTLDRIEEEKQEGGLESPEIASKPIPTVLGSFNANPNFLASAKRIAQFSSTREPIEEDKIVYVDGSFDICHPGHIELLKKARQLGDYLIVGIHEDQCVNQYMGEHYPLNTLHERVLNILACRYVDDVIIGAPFKITDKLIKDLNISVVVKSLDVIQGSIRSEALGLKPYEVPESKDLLADVEIECKMTMKEVSERIISNREAIMKKVIKSSQKQDQYEKQSKFICEVR